MIYLQLFWNFLVVGAVSFGGGYGMISLLRETVLHHAWMNESEFLDFVAVSESTPGPLAVNMATFVGASQGGLLGSLCATVGVVLPAFLIILLIASVLKRLLQYRPIQGALAGVRPCVVAMVLATAGSMGCSGLLGFQKIGDAVSLNVRGMSELGILLLFHFLWKKWNKAAPSPILMIAVSAFFGILFWGIF